MVKRATTPRSAKHAKEWKTSLGLFSVKANQKHGSFEETPDMSRRNSFDFERNATDGDLILIRESKLVSLPAVRDGMIRFQFLLESCTPGTLPDPPLIAAMLDIKAPVVARAAFYLEVRIFCASL